MATITKSLCTASHFQFGQDFPQSSVTFYFVICPLVITIKSRLGLWSILTQRASVQLCYGNIILYMCTFYPQQVASWVRIRVPHSAHSLSINVANGFDFLLRKILHQSIYKTNGTQSEEEMQRENPYDFPFFYVQHKSKNKKVPLKSPWKSRHAYIKCVNTTHIYANKKTMERNYTMYKSSKWHVCAMLCCVNWSYGCNLDWRLPPPQLFWHKNVSSTWLTPHAFDSSMVL